MSYGNIGAALGASGTSLMAPEESTYQDTKAPADGAAYGNGSVKNGSLLKPILGSVYHNSSGLGEEDNYAESGDVSAASDEPLYHDTQDPINVLNYGNGSLKKERPAALAVLRSVYHNSPSKGDEDNYAESGDVLASSQEPLYHETQDLSSAVNFGNGSVKKQPAVMAVLGSVYHNSPGKDEENSYLQSEAQAPIYQDSEMPDCADSYECTTSCADKGADLKIYNNSPDVRNDDYVESVTDLNVPQQPIYQDSADPVQEDAYVQSEAGPDASQLPVYEDGHVAESGDYTTVESGQGRKTP